MSQSLVKIYLHIIFAAFEHTETIPKQHLEEVHAYIGGTLKNHGCMPIRHNTIIHAPHGTS